MAARPVIEVEDLRKRYGSTVAVDGLSFEVREREIFGLVGPNGAGKTTTIECLEGLRRPDSGRVTVLGLNPATEARALRPRIGSQLQESALPSRIRVWEALDLYASFYANPVEWRPLLERLGLAGAQNASFADLSGGQQQRLFIALALVSRPEAVFLDEMTTGLDPHARRAIWQLIGEIRQGGATVLLTTHFMEEAERLCDRVAIIDHGRLVAVGPPAELYGRLHSEARVVVRFQGDLNAHEVEKLPGVVRVEVEEGQVSVYGSASEITDPLIKLLATNGCLVQEIETERPNLEDVFLRLTDEKKVG